MEINASLVKELRQKTGSGMMDCKRALVESKGDIDEAIDYLRKTGAAKAEKKGSRGNSIFIYSRWWKIRSIN